MQSMPFVSPAGSLTELRQPLRGNLPTQLTPLIGCEQEVQDICTFLRRPHVRLLTLIGTGGIGKTRLAVQVASNLVYEYANGVCFVSLAPISDSNLVISTIAQALGLAEAGDISLFEHLKEFLYEKQLLLLLDNFEQVTAAAPLVAELLATCPEIKVIVTSREALRIHGEYEFPVPPLALPDPKHLPEVAYLSQYAAIALFMQRAQAIKPDFRMTDTTALAITEICIRLDGLPLAIELAAARIKLLPPEILLTRLKRRMHVLVSGTRDSPERHQTLHNTMKWSYDLLNADEQRLFRQLSVFVGGCTLDAVAFIYGAGDNEEEHVMNGVASLIDRSLVQQTAQIGNEPWLMMLETIREYGTECLEACGEMEATRRLHAHYYVALAEEAEPALLGAQQAQWLERLEREHDNLRAAMQWSLEQARDEEPGTPYGREIALRLSAALRRFWMIRGHYSEGQDILEQALAGSENVVATVRAKALSAAATIVNIQGDTDRSEALAQESLALYRGLADTAGIALSLHLLGHVAWLRGNLATAGSLLEEALTLFREVDDRDNTAYSLFHLAGLARIQGKYASAPALFEESLALFRELGNKRGIALSLLQLAELLFATQEDQTRVQLLLDEGLALCREVGDKDGIAYSYSLSGQISFSQGDAFAARSLLEESLALYKGMGDRQRTAQSLSGLAKVTAFQGDKATARAFYEESLALARAGHKLNIASGLEGLASVVAEAEPEWAARLWGAAEALREAIGAPIPPVERPGYEQVVAAARVDLGEKVFVSAWARGRNMTPEQAFALQGGNALSALIPMEQSSTYAKRPTTYPYELTAREVEVLRLVAMGLTDIQVAEKLIISPRTVNAHLTSIYSKIHISSRSAATRFALDQHLV